MLLDLNSLHNFKKPIYVYELIDPRDNLPKYIGKTNNVKRRYIEHTSKHNLKTKTIKNNWIKKLFKLNLKPKIRVISILKTDELASLVEIEKIKEFKGVCEAARDVKVGSGQISFCCKKLKGFLSAGGYKWFYKKDFYASV